MTVINGIEIDDINYKVNELKMTLNNNLPLEDKLNVIAVVSNPCLYGRRYKLFNQFINRMNEDSNIRLYIVELVYKDQKFIITDSENKNHLQIRTETPLWHKESMINLGVKYLLPKDYKAFAWIDADIEFESYTWALDTLKILNGYKDIVQLFSHAADMDKNELNLGIYPSLGYNFYQKKKNSKEIRGINYWHPGYAWAITRTAYEKIGGLYDLAILGSGDYIMSMAILNTYKKSNSYMPDYRNSMLKFQEKAKSLRLGFVPGLIRHFYHGSKKNRYYHERNDILLKYDYSPDKHITHDPMGLINPSENFPQEFKDDIMNYFLERKEDE
uniref:Glycosyltransferase n=1 Tax=viral metagenome TaxID=1070528 RepID=A0A6C0KSX5_9ZZZZ